jgi:hypothetical protein
VTSPDERRHDGEPVLATTDDDAQQPDQPELPDLALDELLFGAVSTNGVHTRAEDREPAAQPTLFDLSDQGLVFLDEDRFVGEDQFGDPDELSDRYELLHEDPLGDDTVVVEPAGVVDAEEETEPTGAARGRRRAWVLAATVTLIVVTGAVAGVALVGGSADSAPRNKSVQERTAPRTTTAPSVPNTVPPPTATAATIAPATTVTTGRTMPIPGGVPVQQAPPPPAPPPPVTTPSPPPSTSPPTTAPPSTTSPP